MNRTSALHPRQVRVVAAATAAATAVGALALAWPATAQLPADPPVPVVETIEDLVDMPVLDPLDPVLGPVIGIVEDLVDGLDDVLGEVPLPNVLALQGDDAIDAAVAFSQVTYESSDVALLARDDLFADGLTTGALQGAFDAPLLLTTSGELDRRTAGELGRLGVSRVVVVGGDGAISPIVLQKLEIAGLEVDRISGATRIETSAAALAATASDATTAVLTRAYSSTADDAQAYADLLAVSPWAAQNRWPVLLTQSEVLTPTIRQAIADSSLQEIIIIGGTSAVSQAVQDELVGMGLTVRRVAGATRYATAVAVAAERGFLDSGDTEHLVLAEGGAVRGDVWAPGFAAAAYGARNDAPVLLTDRAGLPPETLQFLVDGLVDNVTGGPPAAVCASFVDPVACTAAGLLLLGDLTGALDGLGLDLGDIPNLADLLDELGLGDLADLLDLLDGTLDGVIEGVVAGDIDAAVAALAGSTAEIEGVVPGLIGSAPSDDPADTVAEVLGQVAGAIGAEQPTTPEDPDGPLPTETPDLPIDPDLPEAPLPDVPDVPLPDAPDLEDPADVLDGLMGG
jgi:putative cell wall-binding protein